MGKIKFSVFADFHYKKGMYISSIKDFETILSRANDEKVDFVIHCGDFANGYKQSPELINLYLNNPYNFNVYGIYGNHEMESEGNNMAFVTPRLTNDDSVVWGTKSGKIEDGSIAYYYKDINGFRLIFTDNNYSINPKTNEWEHSKEGSWGVPKGNIESYRFNPEQLKWFEETIMDAVDKKLTCITFCHFGFCGDWCSVPDYKNILEIIDKANAIREKSVLMCINGHNHTNNVKVLNNVVHFDVNTVRNGSWIPKTQHHYTDDMTYTFADYDENGVFLGEEIRPLTSMWQSINTTFFKDPLNAIVTVSTDGEIEIKGSKTEWLYGVNPPEQVKNSATEISYAKLSLK